MHKLLVLTLMAVVWTMLLAQQIDREMALRTFFEAKRAVNRAAHAAAQQLDAEALAEGIVRIDEDAALAAAREYLRVNLRLDDALMPLPGSMLQDPVETAVFRVVNDDAFFPFTYRNEALDYEATLKRPGVILIVRITYPRGYSVMGPIEWTVKGAAELVDG